MTIQFSLSVKERTLVLKHVQGLDTAQRAQLQFAVAKKKQIDYSFSTDMFSEFLQALAAACPAVENPKEQRALCRIYERLEAVGGLDMLDDGEILEEIPPFIQEELMQALAEKQPETLEEAEAIFMEIAQKYTSEIAVDLGDYSVDQVGAVLESDWQSPDSVLQLHEDIPMDMLEKSDFLYDACLLLGLLHEQQGAKTTKAGNLNRNFVEELAEQMRGCKKFFKTRAGLKTVFNEEDIRPLDTLRHVVQYAGLIRKYKGEFLLTKKGERLFSENHRGELFKELFLSFFREFDLTFFGGEELPEIQDSIAYSFLRLKDLAVDWVSIESICEKLFLPGVLELFPQSDATGIAHVPFYAELRILKPLANFGLLELRHKENEDIPKTQEIGEVRKTPLFDAFLEFPFEE